MCNVMKTDYAFAKTKFNSGNCEKLDLSGFTRFFLSSL